MTTRRFTDLDQQHDTLRVRGPGDLLQAVPYLLGFHPSDSLVLVGLRAGRVAVTARVDLPDLSAPGLVPDLLSALVRGGAQQLVAVVYAPGGRLSAPQLPWRAAVEQMVAGCDEVGIEVRDAILTCAGRWWSYLCADDGCCPADGHRLPEQTSVIAAAATYAGLVALPAREALAATLEPLPEAARRSLLPLVNRCEQTVAQQVHAGRGPRHERAVKRAIFAAARQSEQPEWSAESLDQQTLARFGAALRTAAVRDPLWVAIDGGRLDGCGLWRELGRRLPSPYDAAPLFLLGWQSWRAGNGALAGMAAERALAADPGYSAADLLLAALHHGLDPRRVPRIRASRPGNARPAGPTAGPRSDVPASEAATDR